jgi:endoglucanase
VRRDQGGDTVSEGQAYALLIAVGLDDRATFDRVWAWTTQHLRRDDGLLSWHWAGGRVADPQPAADADLDAAHALRLAATQWHRPVYARTARRMADAMRGAEIKDGVVMAGPWAVQRGTVNPSYDDPRGLAALHMDDVARATRTVVAQLTDSGNKAPTDWAKLGPPPAPTGAYGYDAARVSIRLAASCDPADRAIARNLIALKTAAPAQHPVFTVARAAVADARGDTAHERALLDDASAQDHAHPSYYGAAWVALGRMLLDTSRLGRC